MLFEPNIFFANYGYCDCCDKPVKFIAGDTWLRDSYVCDNCKSIPRERALMYWLKKYFPEWKDLSIHESSPIFRGASLTLKGQCPGYIPSHYYPGLIEGQIINGCQNINLENQRFENDLFDIVITQDVVEHLYNPINAFREISRTLKPGGAHIFTVPLVNKQLPSQKWSELNSNGKIDFLFQPEYHGNPVDDSGSPVAWHWGYDISNFIMQACNMTSVILLKEDISRGIMGEYLEVIVSVKNIS